MQRPITSFSRASDGPSMGDMIQKLLGKKSPSRKIKDEAELPLYDPRSEAGRREMSRSRPQAKWIHIITVLVLFCLFILWWFSYPVNLEIKDGRIFAIHPIKMSPPLNETDYAEHLTVLALATPPTGSVPWILTARNESEVQPARSAD